jgi:hypothetical protein
MIRIRKNYFLLPGNPIYTSAICEQDNDILMAPYSLVNQCQKNMQVIENVLNTPWPRQPMRILLNPTQTTLKANQTLKFTTDSNINHNFHVAGGGEALRCGR